MENRDVAAARKIGARHLDHGIVKVQPTNATDECIGSMVLRDVLTLFQNGGGFDIFILGVPPCCRQHTSLFKVHSLDKEVDGRRGKTEGEMREGKRRNEGGKKEKGGKKGGRKETIPDVW
jgi:hypothetical protein